MVAGVDAREKVASCSATNAAGIRIERVPGVWIAGIAPRRIFLRTDWLDSAHRAASSATVIKLSVIRFSTSVNHPGLL